MLVLSAAQAVAQQSRLSPFTRQYLHALDTRSASQPGPIPGYVYKQAQNGTPLLSAFLQVEPSFSEEALAPLGIHIGTKAGAVWTAQIPVESLRQLTRLAGLRYIQLDEPVVPQLDAARSATRVDSAHAGLGLPQVFNGQGVVVGIIDAGFDYGHPTLFDTTGTGYRVRKVWEQKISGTPPAGYAYGREMTDSMTMWAAGTDITSTSHGAHVAGIAAGSGAGGPGGSRLFRGMAYRSELVLVGITPSPQNWTSTGMTDIIDGMSYVFNYAASVGKPAVVNLSWGCTIGSHDGLSLFSQACDALTGPGKIFCLSAGNNGENNIHLSKTFTATDTLVRSVVSFPSTPSGRRTWVDVWGDTAQAFCLRATLFAGATRVDSTTLICPNNTVQNFSLIGTNGDTCFVSASTELLSFNGKPRVFLNLYNKTGNALCLSIKSTAGTADAWMGFVEGQTGYYGGFSASIPATVTGNTVMSVGDMASTKSAISVGAYMSKKTFTNVSGATPSYTGTLGAIAGFSSRGPTADGRVKPDITGPGLGLASAVSSYDSSLMAGGTSYSSVVHNYVHPTTGRTYPFAMFGGTSMSSPAVAGIVALMLQAAPGLTPAQIKAVLAETAIKDNFTGTLANGPDNTWGAGKANAYGALKKVLEVVAGVQDVGRPTLACLLFPNPGRGQFSLEVGSDAPEELLITVEDVSGRVSHREAWKMSAGNRVKTFDWSGLTQGVYIVRVEGGAHSATMKMVVR